MFFPYRDDNPTTRFPVVTVGLIVTNVLVYLFYQVQGPRVFQWALVTKGLIPVELLHMRNLPFSRGMPPVLNLFTSMFMHGGFGHLAGNMWFLWLFGDNVEDRLGPVRFFLFYLSCGLVAAFSHVVFNAGSTVPVVGASGAISGMLGAYMVLFPHARVRTLVWIFLFVEVVMVPAVVFIGFWILFQVLNGLLSLGMGGGGVAWFAHVGGFVFGLYALRLFLPRARYPMRWR